MGTTSVLRQSVERPASMRRSAPGGRSMRSTSVVIRWFGSPNCPNQKAAICVSTPALVGNAGGQHPIERAEPVGADQQEPIAQVVNVAHFAPSHRQARQRGFQDDGVIHGCSVPPGVRGIQI